MVAWPMPHFLGHNISLGHFALDAEEDWLLPLLDGY